MLFRRKIFALLSFFIIFSGCQNDRPVSVSRNSPVIGHAAVTPVKQGPPYAITEDFELGTKKTYAADTVRILTGVWRLDNALVGTTDADVKNGAKSVRLAKGSLTMTFDIAGVQTIRVAHAKYGSGAKSAWTLYFSTDSGASYQLLATVTDTSSYLKTDSFAVNASGKVRFKITNKAAGRVNIDDITFFGRGDPQLLIGEAEKNFLDTAAVTNSSAERGVKIGADAPPASGDNSNLLFGNPSGAQSVSAMMDNYLMDMGYYVESYNATKAGPNWVSWHVDASNITNKAERRNNFAGFNGLIANWYTVQSDSYHFSKYGFDRGHNCPAADRTSSADANAATFLMTNMIPQAPQNNQHTWNNFEAYLRSLVLQGNELYIIMGSYGTGGTGTKGAFNVIIDDGNAINVPKNIWKVALIVPAGNSDIKRVNTSTRVIAINTPNVNSVNNDWKKYLVSVREIEQATGYNLLSNLPQNIQDVLESRKTYITK